MSRVYDKTDGNPSAMVNRPPALRAAILGVLLAGAPAAVRAADPIVLRFADESTGARMPDIMGAKGIGGGDSGTRYLRSRRVPWVSAMLGPCYGSSSWYAAMSDFVVMRKGAVTAVASPRLTSLATSEALSMGGAGDADEVAAWTTAEVSFMEREFGAAIVHGVHRDGDPAAFAAAMAEMSRETSAYDLAAINGAQAVIDPRETRRWIVDTLAIRGAGVGRHMMAHWPTSF